MPAGENRPTPRTVPLARRSTIVSPGWRRGAARRLSRFVTRRTPLTVATILTVAGGAVWSGALTGGTPKETVERWGFDLGNLQRGRIQTLATMHLLVFGRAHFVSSVALLILFLGPLEAKAGTWIAAKVFWVSAIGGALGTSLLVALPGRVLGWRPIPDLVEDADVGASIGIWGAAGALTILAASRLGGRVWPLRVACGFYLAAALAADHGIADVEHIAGFAIGAALAQSAGLDRVRPVEGAVRGAVGTACVPPT